MQATRPAKPEALSPLPRAAVRWLTFPIAMAIFATSATAIQQRWLRQPELAQMLAFAATALLATAAERLLPFRADWAEVPKQERRTDRSSLLTLFVLVDPLLKLVLMPMLVSLGATALLPVGGLALFPSDWPLPLQLPVAALVAELGSYSLHRLAHRSPSLWRIHSFHHNPARLYWLNGFRVNPLNVAWHQLSSILVLKLLGTPPAVVHMVITLGIVIAVMQHCNADLRYDGWNLLFPTADLHRWHHAAAMGEHAHNFGSLTVVWDRVFGSYRHGHAGPDQVGIAGESPTNQGYLREVWQAYSIHSASARASDASPAAAVGESRDEFCASCPLPLGRSIPLGLRIRSWIPATLSGCCTGE
jgi:sterol desaturase/sphingolipid hydroxylase (fatty acid hydroxylase superfamily)